jgi:hypothetical protein
MLIIVLLEKVINRFDNQIQHYSSKQCRTIERFQIVMIIFKKSITK